MRILITTLPGHGHLNPLLPLVREFVARRHDVVVATSAAFAAEVERHGVPVVAAGDDWQESRGDERFPGFSSWAAPAEYGRVFAELGRSMADDLLASQPAPDLVVHDDAEFGGWLAAEAWGRPHVPVAAGVPILSPLAIELGHAATFAELCGQQGLPVDPTRPSRLGYLDRTPPSMHLVPPSCAVVSVQPQDSLPTRAAGPPSTEGSVLVTMGSVFPARYAGFLARFADACRHLQGEVTIVTGTFAPEALGDLPDNVTVVRWVDLDEHLARASVVVSHGGRGTTLTALARGIPQVLLPYSADQPAWATACSARGVAINLATEPLPGGLFPAIDPDMADPATTMAAIEAARNDHRLRAAAAEVAEEIRNMPSVGAAVDYLQALAR